MYQDVIEDFFGHPEVCGAAINDGFVVVVFFAVQSQTDTVYSKVCDEHLVIPFLDNGCV